MSYATVRLKGRGLRLDQTPERGSVVIRANAPIIADATGDTIFSGAPIIVPLAADGRWRIDLVPTDVVGMLPRRREYWITLRYASQPPVTRRFYLPQSLVEVDYADLALIPEVPSPDVSVVGDGLPAEEVEAIARAQAARVHAGAFLVPEATDDGVRPAIAESVWGRDEEGQVYHDAQGAEAGEEVYPVIMPTGAVRFVSIDPDLDPTEGYVASVAGRPGHVVLTKADVGLANVNNTSDADKPVSSATQTALSNKAPLVHSHTKAQIGLGNVDNTSDAGKPISTATQNALNGKAAAEHTHSKADLGLGNVNNTSDSAKPISSAVQGALNGKANTIHAHSKAQVGLAEVDNTADLDKPISTATQTALGGKANTNHSHSKGDVGLSNVDNTSDSAKPISSATQTALNSKANLSHTHNKSQVGLANVDNTSDVAKPISSATQSALNFKAEIEHTHTKAQVGLNNVNNTADANKPISIATQSALNTLDQKVNDKAALSHTHQASNITGLAPVAIAGTYASLTGMVPTSALPPLATIETYPVSSQSAMLALEVQRGDQAVRTDLGRNFVFLGGDPATLSNWLELKASGDVFLVNGHKGNVVLTKADLGLGNVDNTADSDKPLTTAAVEANTVLQTQISTTRTNLTAEIAQRQSDVAALTSQKADLVHEHDASALTSGILPAARGGTGRGSFTPNRFLVADSTTTLGMSKAAPEGDVVGTTDSQTLSNKVLSSPTITSPIGLLKGDIGLDRVENTNDAEKPLSTAAVAALAAKAPIGQGSDAGVAGYVTTSSSATRTALDNLFKPLGGGRPIDSGRVWVNAIDYGVSTASADNSAALNSAVAAAVARGPEAVLYLPPGVYNITGTVTFSCSLLAHEARLLYTGSGTAVLVGTDSAASMILRKEIALPRVECLSRPSATAWAAGTRGVVLSNVRDCMIRVPLVLNFERGLVVYAKSQKCSDNTVHLGSINDNYRNVTLDSDATGSCQQNTLIGGRIQQPFVAGMSTDDVNAVMIIIGETSGSIPSQNTFIGTSIEGNNPAYYRLDCAGRNNMFINCRWENNGGTSRVIWRASALGNVIDHGFEASALTETFTAGSASNELIDREGPYLKAVNTSAMAIPVSAGSWLTLTGWTIESSARCAYDSGTGLWTPRQGRWRITATVAYNFTGGSCRLLVAGNRVIDLNNFASTSGASMKLTANERFTGLETLAVQVLQGSSACVLSNTAGLVRINAEWVGP